jgi:hypothetical protein
MIDATASCKNPSMGFPFSPVTGEVGKLKCRHVRREANMCGPQGGWFEARGRESGA